MRDIGQAGDGRNGRLRPGGDDDAALGDERLISHGHGAGGDKSSPTMDEAASSVLVSAHRRGVVPAAGDLQPSLVRHVG